MEGYSTFMDWKTQLSKCQDVRLSKLIYRFSAIPIKMPAGYFVYIHKLFLKFLKSQKTQNSQHNIEEEQSWRTNNTRL